MTNRKDISIELEGSEQLIRKLKRLGVEVGDALEISAHVGMAVMRSASNTLAPSSELEQETTEKRKRLVAVDTGPPKKKWYWQFLETGAEAHEISGNPLLVFEGDQGIVATGSIDHPGMAARPFLAPGFDQSHKRAEKEFGTSIKNKAITKVTK